MCYPPARVRADVLVQPYIISSKRYLGILSRVKVTISSNAMVVPT